MARVGTKTTRVAAPANRGKTFIHVNVNTIRSNAKHGACQPVIAIRQGRSVLYGKEVEILGPSSVIYRPHAPLECGAKVWIEVGPGVEVVPIEAERAQLIHEEDMER